MSEKTNKTDSHGYEKRDVSLPFIVKSGIYLTVLVVATFVVVTWGYGVYDDRSGQLVSGTAQPSPLRDEAGSADRLPPGPLLQPDPRAEYELYLEDQQQAVSSYGWADRAAGKIVIPVERAIELAAERGLPTFPADPSMHPAAAAAPPAEPNDGQ